MSTTTADTAVGSTEAAGLASKPPQSKSLSLFTRFRFWTKIWLFKSAVVATFKVMRFVQASKLKPFLPTYTKHYPVRPMLENRVFLPPNAKSGGKYPLLIVVHGGGFALLDPTVDDELNSYFANKQGFVVVAVNYRKAPSYAFPDPVHDVAEITRAVLADQELPVDYSNVVLAGFSAGGNLALAVAQLPGIKEKVRSLLPVVPVVDFSGIYKGEFRTTKEGKPDVLKDNGALFTWAYIKEGEDRYDPLLSPIYAGRDKLPQRIWFICAEYDYLCHEGEIMAKKLAGIEDENETGPEWEKNGIRFRTVPNVQHGWTHMAKSGEAEVQRKKEVEELYKECADWLK
ncbi:Alpha/Beta hydrolase protein [Exophiala viscosa]|uniref:Alpha/Beta hydrolase protein n=1 Tax=Exophiala viscosa TaxID=2486360 RepID=UPI00219212D7|nr:Alpha/Beta hydrolase protein [Exophiala viscosa]